MLVLLVVMLARRWLPGLQELPTGLDSVRGEAGTTTTIPVVVRRTDDGIESYLMSRK